MTIAVRRGTPMSVRDRVSRRVFTQVSVALIAIAAVVGLTQSSPLSQSAHAAPSGPIAGFGKVTATTIKAKGAVVSVNAGTFVLDQTTGAVQLVDAAGEVAAEFVPKVVVDGVVQPLSATITNAGKSVSFLTDNAIRIGANIAAFTANQVGNAAQRCVSSGLMPALTAAVVGAITAGVAGFFAGGFGAVPGAVGGAVLTGFSGFGAACLTAAAKGVVEDTLNGEIPKQIVEIPFG